MQRTPNDRILIVCLLAVASLPATASLAQVPADAVFSGFKPNGEFLFELDGENLKHAEVYLSDRAASYLVIAPELASPLLINPRARSVESVSFMKVLKRDDGSVDLLADASFNSLGAFSIDGQSIVFEVKGRSRQAQGQAAVARRAGRRRAQGLQARVCGARRAVHARRPLSGQAQVPGRSGSGARLLRHLVPRSAADWCRGSCGWPKKLRARRFNFEYYGLPQPMSDDPIAKQEDLHGVPTAIVYVGGKEVKRLSGADLNSPEKAITRALFGS